MVFHKVFLAYEGLYDLLCLTVCFFNFFQYPLTDHGGSYYYTHSKGHELYLGVIYFERFGFVVSPIGTTAPDID